MDYIFERDSFKREYAEWIRDNHYTETYPRNVKYCFIIRREEKILGVMLFTTFSRMQSREKYYGCLELARLYLDESCQHNTASWFISRAIKYIKNDGRFIGIVSYADPTEGHTGAVYKASNFVEIGRTKSGYHYLDREGSRVHKRQVWERAKKAGLTETDQAKIEGLARESELPKFIFQYKWGREEDYQSSKVKPVLMKEFDDYFEVDIDGDIYLFDNEDKEEILNNSFYKADSKYLSGKYKGKQTTLHRGIAKTPRGLVCDHINRSRFDNRRENLRNVDHRINNHNREFSGEVRGVREKKGKWEAWITRNRKRKYLGRFATKIEAAMAYDQEAVQIFGKYAQTNFDIKNYKIPDEPEITITPKPHKKNRKFRKCRLCEKNAMGVHEYCYRHLVEMEREKGGDPKKAYRPRVIEKAQSCVECGKEIFCQNLCASCYRERRIAEGKAERTPQNKKVYLCDYPGCNKRVHLKKLCFAHHKMIYLKKRVNVTGFKYIHRYGDKYAFSIDEKRFATGLIEEVMKARNEYLAENEITVVDDLTEEEINRYLESIK